MQVDALDWDSCRFITTVDCKIVDVDVCSISCSLRSEREGSLRTATFIFIISLRMAIIMCVRLPTYYITWMRIALSSAPSDRYDDKLLLFFIWRLTTLSIAFISCSADMHYVDCRVRRWLMTFHVVLYSVVNKEMNRQWNERSIYECLWFQGRILENPVCSMLLDDHDWSLAGR